MNSCRAPVKLINCSARANAKLSSDEPIKTTFGFCETVTQVAVCAQRRKNPVNSIKRIGCRLGPLRVDFEFQYRADTGEAVEQCGNERPVPQPRVLERSV